MTGQVVNHSPMGEITPPSNLPGGGASAYRKRVGACLHIQRTLQEAICRESILCFKRKNHVLFGKESGLCHKNYTKNVEKSKKHRIQELQIKTLPTQPENQSEPLRNSSVERSRTPPVKLSP